MGHQGGLSPAEPVHILVFNTLTNVRVNATDAQRSAIPVSETTRRTTRTRNEETARETRENARATTSMRVVTATVPPHPTATTETPRTARTPCHRAWLAYGRVNA